MAYSLTELNQRVKPIAERATKVATLEVAARTVRQKAQSRFQPIEQIMSRFDNMENMFAAA